MKSPTINWTLRTSLQRVLDSLPSIFQIVVAATAAYSISYFLLGHKNPIFAVTVTIASLGFTRDARIRRVFQTAIGMVVGIALSEVMVLLIGGGIWQTAIVLLIALVAARFLSGTAAFALTVASPITVALEDNSVVVTRPDDERVSRSLHGLTRTLINNLIVGVTQGYTKGLEIVGTGYRVTAKGSDIEFALGYSHPILVKAPAGITFTVEGNTKLTVSGIDKQAVGEVAANLRKLRKPEPYKGKGVRYAGEVVRRKAGKSGK